MKTMKQLITALMLLVSIESFGQYQFTTIQPFSSEMVQSYLPYLIDSNGALISLFFTNPNNNTFALGKYNNSTWSIIDSVSSQSINFLYPFLTLDKNNNIWQVSNTKLMEWQGNTQISYSFPTFVTQAPTVSVVNLLADDSGSIWTAMSISDTSNTTYASSLWLIKFNSGTFQMLRLIDYDTSNQFISTFTSGFGPFFVHGGTMTFTGSDNIGNPLVYTFNGSYLTSRTSQIINTLVPLDFIGYDAYGNLLGLYQNSISAYNSKIWFNAFDEQFTSLYHTDTFLLQSYFPGGNPSLDFPAPNGVDKYNTYWYVNADSLYYLNLNTQVSGKITLPSYLQLPYSGAVSGFQISGYTPYYNKAKNSLLLLSTTSGTSTNPRPNTRFMEFNLDTFYHYLPMPGGPNQTICQNTTAQMAALGFGTWTALPTNPVTANIINPTSPITMISGFTATGTYRFIWNSNALDTISITVTSTITPLVNITAAANVINSGSFFTDTFTATPTNGGLNPTYTWYVDGSNDGNGPVFTPFSSQFNSGDSVWVVMTSSFSCAVPANITSNKIFITVPISGSIDSVWPGDADANHIVDNTDLLTIGLAYDSIGPVRAVQGIVWQADQAINWNDSFSVYAPAVNFKHADCNGDGIINSADTVAIMANYSLTHAKTGPMLAPWRNGIPAIKAVLTPDTAYNGDTLTVTFVLGDTNTTVNNLYGLAFRYNFDPLVVDSTFPTRMGFLPTSWMGTPSQKISINKIFSTTGQIQAAVTRINHTSASGHGAIATASFKITTDNISGKNYSYYTNKWSITDVIAIDQYGDPIPLNAGADSSTVGFYPTGIREVTTETLHIQPNPARDKVMISAGNVIKEISLSNIMGQQVMNGNPTNSRSVSIDVSDLESGVYVVQVKTDKGTGIEKLIIEK